MKLAWMKGLAGGPERAVFFRRMFWAVAAAELIGWAVRLDFIGQAGPEELRLGPLFSSWLRLSDLLDTMRITEAANASGPSGLPWVPMALLGLLAQADDFLPGLGVVMYLALAAAIPITGLVAFWRASAAKALGLAHPDRWVEAGLLMALLLSFGFVFGIDRGNWAPVACGAIFWFGAECLQSNKSRAAFWLALACSIKIFPLMFILALLPSGKRYWKDSLRAIAWVAVWIVALHAAAWAINACIFPFYTLQTMAQGQAGYRDIHLLRPSGLTFNASIMGLPKLFSFLFGLNGTFVQAQVANMAQLNTLVTALFALLTLIVAAACSKMAPAIKIACMAWCLVFLPPVEGSYYLPAMFCALMALPWLADGARLRPKAALGLIACVALMGIPKDYWWWGIATIQPTGDRLMDFYVLLRFKNGIVTPRPLIEAIHSAYLYPFESGSIISPLLGIGAAIFGARLARAAPASAEASLAKPASANPSPPPLEGIDR